jgi:hypothetical protein
MLYRSSGSGLADPILGLEPSNWPQQVLDYSRTVA